MPKRRNRQRILQSHLSLSLSQMASAPAQAAAPPQLFSCGVQIANLLVSSDLVHQALSAISELNNSSSNNYATDGVITTTLPPFLIRSKTFNHNNSTVIVFASIPQQQQQILDLQPTLHQNDPFFEFLPTKDNPSFCINQTVLSLFHTHATHYQQIVNSTTPLILVGHSLGAAVAALFTLWLLEKGKSSAPRILPLCITFGSPLIGDDGLHRAVSKRQRWGSRFLNVIVNDDPIPRSFIGNRSIGGIDSGSARYKPFGTFLFCSQLGSACIDDPDSVVELMNGTTESLILEQRYGHYGYWEILQYLRQRIATGGSVANTDLSSLRAGLTLQLRAIGIGEETQEQYLGSVESLISAMEKRERKNYQECKTAMADGNKKLNDMKIRMANMEWYVKSYMMEGVGYYDCYKSCQTTKDYYIIKFKISLNQYWEDMVAEAENKPQKEGSAFRTRFLFAGTNCRRMVEPLLIADYYKIPGNRNYRTNGRPHHFKVLEKWHAEGREQRQSRTAPSLTEDSCFWADVEDALIDLQELRERSNRAADMESGELGELRRKLENFENYVMGLIQNAEVSKDIFLKNSSFMQWWRDYKTIVASNYHSPLTDYMNNQRYINYS